MFKVVNKKVCWSLENHFSIIAKSFQIKFQNWPIVCLSVGVCVFILCRLVILIQAFNPFQLIHDSKSILEANFIGSNLRPIQVENANNQLDFFGLSKKHPHTWVWQQKMLSNQMVDNLWKGHFLSQKSKQKTFFSDLYSLGLHDNNTALICVNFFSIRATTQSWTKLISNFSNQSIS